jgi:predicted transcriptional regulator
MRKKLVNPEKPILIRFPADIHRALKELSFYSERPMNAIVKEALDQFDVIKAAHRAKQQWEAR